MSKTRETKKQLMNELAEARRRIVELEASEAEHKRAEEALRESEEHYRSMVESIDIGLNLIDCDHNMIMVNAAQGRHFNKSPHEMIGKKCFRELEKRDAVCPHCPGVQAIATGRPAEVETHGVRDDGSHFNVRLRAFPIFGQDGTVRGFVEIGQDITERRKAEAKRKQAEEALRDRNALMDALMDNIPDSIYFKDRQCRLIRISRKMMQDLELSEMSQAIGKTDMELFGEKFGRKTLAEDQRIIATGEPIISLIESRRLENGQINWALTTKVPLRDASDQIVGLMGITREINELMRAEEALRESEKRFKDIAQSSADWIWEVNKEGRYTSASGKVHQILGYEPEELIGKTPFELMPEDEAKRVGEAFEKIASRKKPIVDLENWNLTKDGERVCLLTNGVPILDEEGDLQGYRGVDKDITERKRAEEALAHERDLLQALMDNIPDTIYFKDTASRFMRINRAQVQVLGVKDSKEALGKTDFDFFTPEHARDAYADEQEIVNSGQPLIGKVERIRRANGQFRWVSATKVPIVDEEGQVTGTVGISRDITERKRAEEQLQHYATELEQVNEEVKHFAYIVSHDLRAPLINLKGFVAELRSALEVISPAIEMALPHLDEKQRQDVTVALKEDVPEALGFIDSSATHMDRFISSVLTLSRLGRRELHPEPLDMEALVQATLQTLSHQIEERQAKVTVGPLPEVVADRTSMEQIMSNLLDNVVKYLAPDRHGEIEITAERGLDEATFHVRDNGCGIAEEDMDKVFVPFRRAGRQDVPGEGMGLAYVQTLVRRHGGHIWCESELGVGTTFTFTIPHHLTEGDNHG
jgi:PAS domain S-box-containing protein